MMFFVPARVPLPHLRVRLCVFLFFCPQPGAFAALIACVLLTACGGGSSSSASLTPSPIPTPSPRVQESLVIAPKDVVVLVPTGSLSAAASQPDIAAFLAGASVSPAAIGEVSNDAPAVFPLGATRVTFTAHDAAGNIGQAVATVLVTDNRFTVTSYVGTPDMPGPNIAGLEWAGVQALLRSADPSSITRTVAQIGSDAAGNMYFSSVSGLSVEASGGVLFKVSPQGIVTILGYFDAVTMSDLDPGFQVFPADFGPEWADGKPAALLSESMSGLNTMFVFAVSRRGEVAATDGFNVFRLTPSGFVKQAGQFAANDPDIASPACGPLPIVTPFNDSRTGPTAAALDEQGNMYVGCGWTIRKISRAGEVRTVAGQRQASPARLDGQGTAARLLPQRGMALDKQGNLFWAESNNDLDLTGGSIVKMTPSGEVVTVSSGPQFNRPVVMGVDETGNVLVTDFDSYGHESLLRQISPTGGIVLAPGPDPRDMISCETSLSCLSADRSFAVDSEGNQLWALSAYRSDADGSVYDEHYLYRIDHLGGSTLLSDTKGRATTAYSLDSTLAAADVAGNMYLLSITQMFSPYGDGKLGLGFVAPGQKLQWLDGTELLQGYSFLTGNYLYSAAMAIDPQSTVYVVMVAKGTGAPITLRARIKGGVTSTLASLPMAADANYFLPKCKGCHGHYGLGIDKTGQIYLSMDDVVHRFTADGVANGTFPLKATPVVGSPVRNLAGDSKGNMYQADMLSNVIYKIDPSGVVTTFAGSGTRGYLDGPAAAARFARPTYVAVDGDDNVYVVDAQNFVIRKITQTGIVSTVSQGGRVFNLPFGHIWSADVSLAAVGKRLLVTSEGGTWQLAPN